ncbi:MAG: hypothetical protein KA821_10095 [Chitinophagaceae bacterium]|nr:hypothetical protein [Chitinophagaceae bacterium]
MLEQIASLVKQYGQETVVNNPAVDNENNSAVMAEATKTITAGFQNLMAGGGLQDIISMFTNTGSGGQQGTGGVNNLLRNPVVTMMIGHLISKLTTKFNMSPAAASQLSNQLVPSVVEDMVTRTASTDPENDGFNLNSLVGALSGGQAAGNFNFQELISQVTSGNGSADLQNIISQVTEGAQQSRTDRSGGGIGDLIKGLFN